MTLQVWIAEAATLERHFESCDTPNCELCATCLERWAIEYARDYAKKQEDGNV